MSLKSGIFNSTTVTTTETGLLRGDKAVDAEFLARMFSSFFRTGLIVGEDSASFFSSVSSGTMAVVTRPGACHIEGYFAYDDAPETRTFSVMQKERTAARVLRLDLNDGSIRTLWRDCVRQGPMLISSEDGALLPVRSGGVYDLVTCVVDIPAGAEVLTSDMVTDLRGDSNYCGFCTAY